MNNKEGYGNALEDFNLQNTQFIQTPTLEPLGKKVGMYQPGLIRHIAKERPDIVFIFANPRFLSTWTTIIAARIFGCKVYGHGHGLYKRKNISTVTRILWNAMFSILTKYICYTPFIRDGFISFGFNPEKLVIAANSEVNEYPISPSERSLDNYDILFIGRLRADSYLPILIKSIESIRDTHTIPINLHVIGDGVQMDDLIILQKKHPWVKLYGKIYDKEKIRDISKSCIAGCYPGNAGLSILHMMSLSLPPITHDNLYSHGPEVSYIRHDVNGLLFDHKNPEDSLKKTILSLLESKTKLASLQEGAYSSYQELINPSLAERFDKVFSDPHYVGD